VFAVPRSTAMSRPPRRKMRLNQLIFQSRCRAERSMIASVSSRNVTDSRGAENPSLAGLIAAYGLLMRR